MSNVLSTLLYSRGQTRFRPTFSFVSSCSNFRFFEASDCNGEKNLVTLVFCGMCLGIVTIGKQSSGCRN